MAQPPAGPTQLSQTAVSGITWLQTGHTPPVLPSRTPWRPSPGDSPRLSIQVALTSAEGPHLLFRGQHGSTQERAVAPVQVAATGIVPQPRLPARQRAIAVHRVHHVPDIRVFHRRHGNTIRPRRYPDVFSSPRWPPGTVSPGASLDQVLSQAWGTTADDAVAQRFTPPVLRTLRHLNAAMKSARLSAAELIRFTGEQHGAFEARFVAKAEPAKGAPGAGPGKTALAGVDELLATVTDDDYRIYRTCLTASPRSTA
jgi:hypothetical protein